MSGKTSCVKLHVYQTFNGFSEKINDSWILFVADSDAGLVGVSKI